MEKLSTLGEKLLEVQKELGVVIKDSDNPFFKSKYADINAYIDALKPILSKHGLVLLQPLTEKGVGTKVIDSTTGETIETYFPLPAIQDPQKMGSAITYFRRYSLQSLFVMKAEDNDGNEITNEDKSKDW